MILMGLVRKEKRDLQIRHICRCRVKGIAKPADPTSPTVVIQMLYEIFPTSTNGLSFTFPRFWRVAKRIIITPC